MGQAQIQVDAMAGATDFPHQGVGPTGLAAEADADPGEVGNSPAGLLLPANGAPTATSTWATMRWRVQSSLSTAGFRANGKTWSGLWWQNV
jgi:hypothetical protein